MTLLKDAALVVLSALLAFFVGNTLLGFQFYALFFPEEAVGSGFFGFGALGAQAISMVVVYLFFLPLLLQALGSKFKIWWIAVFLLPVVWFVVSTDLSHIWFYVLIALVGWGIGFGLHKIYLRHAKAS
jgi:hypothetical protein